MRAGEIWERWFTARVLAPALGQGRATRRVAELAEIRDRILEHATVFPHADVLDLGCGTGLLTFPAAEAAGTATGLDIDLALLRAAAEVPALGASLVCGDARTLPFPDDRFDIVVWRGLLAYAPDRGRIVREALRVLRPEGRLSISESLAAEIEIPGTDPEAGQLWKALNEIAAAALGERALSRRTLEQELEKAGFELAHVRVERRKTTLEDERAVREVFEGHVPGALSLANLWQAAGVPDGVVRAFLDSLIASTPMRIGTPEGYATAMKPRAGNAPPLQRA
ncbi:MAG: hypothetical protein NVSMB57_02220 [Actinomycetota bacterium]